MPQEISCIINGLLGLEKKIFYTVEDINKSFSELIIIKMLSEVWSSNPQDDQSKSSMSKVNLRRYCNVGP